MQFIASNGRVVPEYWIQHELLTTIKHLKKGGYSYVLFWEKEFFEWYLDRKIGFEENGEIHNIRLHKDITEDELRQLEQLKDYLEL